LKFFLFILHLYRLSKISFIIFRDEAGIWWLINIKTFKIKNIEKFKKIGETLSSPNLDYFINRRKGAMSGIGNVKFLLNLENKKI